MHGYQGFRTAPVPSGWGQLSDNWVLRWSGRQIAQVSPAKERGGACAHRCPEDVADQGRMGGQPCPRQERWQRVLPLALIPGLLSTPCLRRIERWGDVTYRSIGTAAGRRRHCLHQASKSSRWIRSDLALCLSLTAVSRPLSIALRIVLAEHVLCSAASATVISLSEGATRVSPCARHGAAAEPALPPSGAR